MAIQQAATEAKMIFVLQKIDGSTAYKQQKSDSLSVYGRKTLLGILKDSNYELAPLQKDSLFKEVFNEVSPLRYNFTPTKMLQRKTLKLLKYVDAPMLYHPRTPNYDLEGVISKN